MEMLARLCDTWGPSGSEQEICEVIASYAKQYADSLETDNLGNLIVRRGTPGGKRIMLSAHMDEIGVIVNHIDEKGFLRFNTVGGMSPVVLFGQTVRFKSGLVGSVGCDKIDDIKQLQIDKLYIDIGASSQEAAATQVAIGDMACYNQRLTQVGNRVLGKALDDRVGCYVLLAAMQRLERTANDCFFTFSVQEEVGLRGATTAAYAIKPDMGIAVDVTGVGDTPNSRVMSTALGKGAAIKVMDHSVICHPKVRHLLTDTAQAAGIKHQGEVLPYGGTDAGAIHMSRAGVPSGAVSIPTRYIHTPAEMVDMDDVNACVDLLVALLSRPIEF